MTEPVFCWHPHASTEYHTYPGRWVRRREGRRWRLEWRPPHGVHVKRCPACPAMAMQLDMGMAVRIELGPWLMLPVKEAS